MTLEQLNPEESIKQQAGQERDRAVSYREYWEEMHPRPVKPNRKDLSFFKMMGLEASGLAVSSVSGLLLAALRTGAIFMLAEQLLLDAFNFPDGPLKTWLPRA